MYFALLEHFTTAQVRAPLLLWHLLIRDQEYFALQILKLLVVSDAVKVIASGVLATSILCPGTMSLNIAEFPQDILLELAKRLDVADLLSLLSVSQSLCGRRLRYLTFLFQALSHHPRTPVREDPVA
jgi:hypothetical protein